MRRTSGVGVFGGAVFLPFVLLAMAGCVSYTPPAPSPLAPPESDAQAKQFVPPDGKGNLYVARADEIAILGRATPFSVMVNGQEVGGIMPGMYYCFALEPGKHRLSASSKASRANETVTVEAGKNYFYQLSSSSAPDHTVTLRLGWVILEPMGKLMIQQGRRGEASIQ